MGANQTAINETDEYEQDRKKQQATIAQLQLLNQIAMDISSGFDPYPNFAQWLHQFNTPTRWATVGIVEDNYLVFRHAGPEEPFRLPWSEGIMGRAVT